MPAIAGEPTIRLVSIGYRRTPISGWTSRSVHSEESTLIPIARATAKVIARGLDEMPVLLQCAGDAN